MANTTLSALTSVTAPLVSTDVFLITRSAGSYKVAMSVVQDFLEAANNTWTGTNTFNTNIVLDSGVTIGGVDLSTIASTYLGLAGGTMTGNITLAGAPSSGLHPTTKTYVDAADALKANLASPTLTGTPLAPTAATSASTTQIATTAFVKNVLDALIFNQTVVAAATKTLAESESGFILVDYTSTGGVTITLPEISTYSTPKRVVYYIKDTGLTAGTNNIVINANAADTIDSAASVTISTDGEDLILFNNGATEWYIIAKDTVASATKVGGVELATSSEVLALTDTTRVVTPATLGAAFEDRLYKVTIVNAATHTLAEAESGIISVTRTSTGTLAMTIPSAAGLTDASKVIYTIVDAGRNAGTYNITLTPAAGTINGAASYVLSSDGASVTLYNNGTNWIAASDTQAAVTEAIATSDIWQDGSTYTYYANNVAIGQTSAPANSLEIREASGDPAITFDINGTNRFTLGVDDSDNDIFKISGGSVLGTNDWFEIATSGDITLPGSNLYIQSNQWINFNGVTDTAYLWHTSNALTLENADVAGVVSLSASNGGEIWLTGTGEVTPDFKIDSGGDMTVKNGSNFIFSATTGTKFGTATSQKLAFFNSTPIVQPGATTDLGTVLSDLGLRAVGTAYPITTTGAVNVGAAVIFSGIETIAAGGTSTALSLTKSLHSVDSDAGGDIFTLADGTIGQIMTIVQPSSTGVSTITPTNLAGGTSVTLNAEGDSVVLQFVDTQWYVLGGNSYSII